MNRIFAFIVLSLPIASYSANFTIPNGDVSSFISALQTANGNDEADTIFLALGGLYTFTTANNTINNDGPNALPAITNDVAGLDLVIIGNGATLQRSGPNDIRCLYLNGGPELKIFDLNFHNFRTSVFKGGAICAKFQNTVLTVSGCTFTNNVCAATGAEDGGGAIRVHQAELTVLNCTFLNNQGNDGGAIKSLQSELVVEDSYFAGNQALSTLTNSNGGGAISVDGAKATNGSVSISRSEFHNNLSMYQGGALMLFFYNQQHCTLTDCYFDSNRAQKPASIQGPNWGFGGGVWLGGTLLTQTHEINRCTFSGNRADRSGGGLYLNRGTLSMINSTVFQNQAVDPANSSSGLGGGIFVQGGSNNTIANFDHLSIAENHAGFEGGGVRGGNTNITLSSCIVANNTANNSFGNKQNCADNLNFQSGNPTPYFSDGGNNLEFPAISNTSNNGYGTISASLNTADPLLGGLATNGGKTPTLSLLAGSPAIDAGGACVLVDQRDFTRVGVCDIGAFEFGAGSAALPLVWGNIWIEEDENQLSLLWETFEEVNTLTFEVERQQPGQAFEVVDLVLAKGNGNHLYRWQEPNLPLSETMYRVRQWDADGKNSLSQTVVYRGKASSTLRVGPNPAVEVITLSGFFAESSRLAVSFHELSGRVLFSQTYDTQTGSWHQMLDVATFPAGIYLLSVDAGEQQLREKIVIRR